MAQKFTNNARSLLAVGISDTDTSMTIEAAKADLYPVANTGTGAVGGASDWFKATLQDAMGNVEIVYVRTRTSGSAVFSNVMRAQEGTTARAFAAGVVVGLRITAADVEGSIASGLNSVQLSGDQTVAGVKTFSSTIQGSVSGSAGSATNATNAANVGITDDTTTNATHYVHFGSASTGNDNVQVSSSKLTFNPSTGNLTSVDVTISSDERLKESWRGLPYDFLERLAAVKHGTYTRVDTGQRQAGVSAQSLRPLLPEAVAENEEGMLSVAYGNAALVAAIALANEVMSLRARLERLEQGSA